MTVELMNPDGLARPDSYSHVATTSGTRIVFVAGQVAEDPDGNIVGPSDLAAQARQAFSNLACCLTAVGARPEDVARITIYVVGHRPDYLRDIEAARVTVFADHKPVDTIVGVETLAQPGYLIEVEAIAVLD
jgi:enamine deaminase RidA (YjgF/YER057c/UK114 family)